MEVFLKHGRRTYSRQALGEPTDFRAPFDGRAYPCLVWDHDGAFADAERQSVGQELIRSNCRYVVCGGANGADWENAADEAFVLEYLDRSAALAEQRHVMTTSHDGESPEDVAFFFVLNTNFAEHDFTDLLVLHIGGTLAGRRLVEESVRRVEMGEASV